ncbi:uncharacterized protein DSM5745_03583 [Aspergillus mulundensis]|uniref:Uncharacterized protein n=1 Tax=Aspergillus mulundensis TaxID=1810919 RepID=A0A3D8SL79_9EURO|nr:hypothetical protein DSM5745_03583 [Aspergillus mulundensis]RDW86941.1 hypothetical protein DSM5745_03583 [Aspergillus mulundensis]
MCSFPYHAYTVGWICALPIELAAAEKLLDEKHPSPPHDAGDSTIYTLGRIHAHNVVIAALPAGRMGLSPAAVVAQRMQTRFPCIRFSLLVGVGGAVPGPSGTVHDIRLGDVVVSQPANGHGGVVQYDFGKYLPSGFKRTGFLNSPPDVLLHALTKLMARQLAGGVDLSVHLDRFAHLPAFSRSRAGPDLLFQSGYQHVGGSTCDGCNTEYLVERKERGAEPVIHCGAIASGNQVVRDAVTRDAISAELGGVLCFEMEAAGMISSCPCLVIRGMCDYADSHKNKSWQPYAAAAAAAASKEILSYIPEDDVARDDRVGEAQHDLLPAGSTPVFLHTVPDMQLTVSVGTWNAECIGRIENTIQGDTWTTHTLTSLANKLKDTHSVFWFSAKTPQSFQDGFSIAADAISRVDHAASGRGHWDSVSRLQHWLSDPAHGRWLVFVDDLPDALQLSSIRKLFPQRPLGGLVISTSLAVCEALDGITYRLDPTLPPDEGLDVFSSVYGDASSEVLVAARGIVQAVNFHPLGILLSASYLRAYSNVSAEKYRQTLEKMSSQTGQQNDLPPEIALPLSMHLDALANTPSGYTLAVLSLLDTDRIEDKFLNALQTLEENTGPCAQWLSALTSPNLRQRIKTLQSLFLIEGKRDVNGAFYEVPRYVTQYILQNLHLDHATFHLAAETAYTLLDSLAAPSRIDKLDILDEAIPPIERHYPALAQHICSLRMGINREPEPESIGRFQNLGILIALYHLRKAARRGLDVCTTRSLRGWLTKNRTLSDEDLELIEPSLVDEVPPCTLAISHAKTSAYQCDAEAKLAGPVSSVLWTNVEGLLVVSAMSRAWFTIKDGVLDAARAAQNRGYAREHAEEIEDAVDKAAHEAVMAVVGVEVREYVRAARATSSTSSFGSGSGVGSASPSRHALKHIVRLVPGSPDESFCAEIREYSDDELATIVSDAMSHDIFGLTRLAGAAWASVLEKDGHRISTVVQSLVQQATNMEGLTKTARFTIEQLARGAVRVYVREIGDAIWEGVRCAGTWIAIMVRQALSLAMLKRIQAGRGQGPDSVKAMVAGSAEMLRQGVSAIPGEYLKNWEWRALRTVVVLRHRAVMEILQLLNHNEGGSYDNIGALEGFDEYI